MRYLKYLRRPVACQQLRTASRYSADPTRLARPCPERLRGQARAGVRRAGGLPAGFRAGPAGFR
jgi:hypothetical protein